MTQCLLDRPAAQALPTTREWITDFLNAEGDHWDGEAAIAMTSEALFSALAHADRPVSMAARRVAGAECPARSTGARASPPWRGEPVRPRRLTVSGAMRRRSVYAETTLIYA